MASSRAQELVRLLFRIGLGALDESGDAIMELLEGFIADINHVSRLVPVVFDVFGEDCGMGRCFSSYWAAKKGVARS